MTRVRLTFLAAAFLLVLPAGPAGGAATPLSPAPGAVVESSHPVFTWSVPPNEESDAIYIADSAETTVEGRFFDENVVDLDVFFGNETSWSPSTPLPAGTYWWTVRTHDRETFDSFYSAPVSFTIAARTRIQSIRIRRYTFIDNLDIRVRFTANTNEARVTVRLRQGSRTVWRETEIDEFVWIGKTSSAYFSWFSRGRVREGARLRLEVTVTAGGAKASATRTVRAP
jgi:hypothetical protein